MKLLADSGSTKTDWLLTDDDGKAVSRFTTQGINPVTMSAPDVQDIICHMIQEHPEVHQATEVEFYGAGCTPEACPLVNTIFRVSLMNVEHIIVDSDIIGAAKALCGEDEGIACILGTGANSCLWDGHQMIAHTACLGYILGDEGGGAVLGRSLINLIYKGDNSQLREEFEAEYDTSVADIIERVYHQPLANRWLASLSPFICSHLSVPEIRTMVIDNFRLFFRKNINPYNRHDLPINFVGSVAYYYQSELTEAAHQEGYEIGKIMKSPI